MFRLHSIGARVNVALLTLLIHSLNIWKHVHDFLSSFYWHFFTIAYRFWENLLQILHGSTLTSDLWWSSEVNKFHIIRKPMYDFLFDFYGQYSSIYYRFREKAGRNFRGRKNGGIWPFGGQSRFFSITATKAHPLTIRRRLRYCAVHEKWLSRIGCIRVQERRKLKKKENTQTLIVLGYVPPLSQSCPRVTFLGPDPAKRWPDPTRDCRQKVWPDFTRPVARPSPICTFFNWIIIY